MIYFIALQLYNQMDHITCSDIIITNFTIEILTDRDGIH